MAAPHEPSPGEGRGLELWAGVECTVNRVGDVFRDQLQATGHAERDGDIDLLRWLGPRRVRYPVLWERTSADASVRPAVRDWCWADRRLGRLRDWGIDPVVGLLHHGSGPRGTSLVDAEFPEKLAAYAASVARRYPWVDHWTPINEPLTTARFSTLYGHWYPHARDLRLFVRAMINQCLGIARAMEEIRQVNPGARLVQTEDVGRILGSDTPGVAEQVEYENHRRLLTWDLLTGRVTDRHPLWRHLLESGALLRELDLLAARPCPPSLLGLNYYLTSDRFLDGRLDRYPAHLHGGNGRVRYVDVEAVRVERAGVSGHSSLLDELGGRYGLPLAFTEVHLGCTREEQLRWFHEAWRAAEDGRARGLDVRAVTLWSAFGCCGWDTLATSSAGRYEPGAFDARGAVPRPTAVARRARALCRGETHPLAVSETSAGWWRRPARVLRPPPASPPPRERQGARLLFTVAEAPRPAPLPGPASSPGPAPFLVTGANGTLGRAFAEAASRRNLPVKLLCRAELDITDAEAVRRAIDAVRPWAVVNAAGYVRVDDAEREPERCWHENVSGAVSVGVACREAGVPLAVFSSDLVFDGCADHPYQEHDRPSPLGVYGASKAVAEAQLLDLAPATLVIRTAAFFGAFAEQGFVGSALSALRAGRRFPTAADLVVSPTFVPELADATLDLMIDGERGIWHLANEGEVSWTELARWAARLAGLGAELIDAVPHAQLGLAAARPRYSALGSARGRQMDPLGRALGRYVAALGWSAPTGSPRAGRGQSKVPLSTAVATVK